MSEERLVATCRVASTLPSRLRGLLWRGEGCMPIALVRCHAIHTYGMSFPLDVAMVDEHGKVLWARRGMKPGNRASYRGATVVLERPSCHGTWPKAGDKLVLKWTEGRKDGSNVEVWICSARAEARIRLR